MSATQPDDEEQNAQVIAIREESPDLTMSDEALAAAACTGDPASVAALFDRFRDPVFRFLTRLLGKNDEVEDLVQATFMVVVGGRSHFEGRSKASTWIMGIAANIARTHRRTKSRRARFLEAFEFAQSTHVDVRTDAQVDAARTLERVHAVLLDEPIERRMAFVLCEMEGMSAREAATALGTSETAIWKRVSDTRRRLRGVLKNPNGRSR